MSRTVPKRNHIVAMNLLLSGLFLSLPAFAADPSPAGLLWLADLDLSKMTSGWGKPLPNQSIQAQPLTLAGRVYKNGVGTHADSLLCINLKGSATRFTAFLGVDDETQKKGSIQGKIYGDGKKLFDSGILRGGTEPAAIDLNVEGIQQLILVITDAGDGADYDHADLADAAIEYDGTAPEAIDPPQEERIILTPPPGPAPHINGPRVYGARPGNPFLYRIPATGTRPIKFSAQNLPDTLTLDAATGIITGDSPRKRGEYPITLKAENTQGSDTRIFKLIVGDTLALTPPMGWNSWYIFYDRVTDQDMRQAADAMIDTGMADYGYQYVNIDDCWAKKSGDEPYRDENGSILPNASFPDMKALTDYIHSKGLKAGIYTSPGPWTCAGYTGSFRHEQQDALTFAAWGFDFLKYDWCSYDSIAVDKTRYEYVRPYALMGEILKNVDYDIVYNICQYGMDRVWEWAASTGGNCWRTTDDMRRSSSFVGMGLDNAKHYDCARPGYWNDPDYILIGWIGGGSEKEGIPCSISPNQQYAYMSMWSLMASPLIFSGNMTKLDDFTISVLCNAEVIEANQDPLGQQCRIAKQTDESFVLVKDLEDGSKAVGLFNTAPINMPLRITWDEMALRGPQRPRDLWRQKDLDTVENFFEPVVPARGVVLVRLFPEK